MTDAAARIKLGLANELRLGNLDRYMPYPVVGGFLAGTGLLLVRGGVGILTGTDAPLRNSPPGFGLHEEFVLLAIPDMNGSLRGKALRENPGVIELQIVEHLLGSDADGVNGHAVRSNLRQPLSPGTQH